MQTKRSSILKHYIDEGQKRLTDSMSSVVSLSYPDDNDMASSYENIYLVMSMLTHEQNRLAQIQQCAGLLEVLPDARCVDCGEPIAAQRLKAVPYAIRCTCCQEEWEKERKCGEFLQKSIISPENLQNKSSPYPF